jgi:hypothetical protein
VTELLEDVQDCLEYHHPLDLLDEILTSVNLNDEGESLIDTIIKLIDENDEIQEFFKDFSHDEDDEVRYVRYIGLFFQVEDPHELWLQYNESKKKPLN